MRVYFFQPKNFNRTQNRTNPFFDPIIRICEGNGIEWRIYNPGKRSKCGYPCSRTRDSRFLRKAVFFFAKCLGRLMKHKTEYEIDRICGRIWNALTFGRYRADIYITIASELYGVLPGINPCAKIVDVMHGIFFPGHSDYLSPDGSVSPSLKRMKERDVWVAGEGYRRMFLRKEQDSSWVERHIKVTGVASGYEQKPLAAMEKTPARLFVSLQINNGLPYEGNLERFEMIVEFMRKVAPKGIWNGYPVLIKHHPRFRDCFDMSPMLEEFPSLQFVETRDWRELSREVLLHATIDSTTAFDFAAYGVPTYFILDGSKRDRETSFIWHETFDYPLWGKSVLEIATAMEKDLAGVSDAMVRWFRTFYGPVDEKSILCELTGGPESLVR